MDSDFEVTDEPLWAIPRQIADKIKGRPDSAQLNNFVLSAIYCGVAIVYLLLFAFISLLDDQTRHAMVLFGFVVVTVAVFAVMWFAGWYAAGKHVTTLLMGMLCLYLFYSGGSSNTGPLYYFVFPPVALFLQGRLNGFISVIALIAATMLLQYGFFGFDTDRYSQAFISRIYSVSIIITLLTFIPEYVRMKTERELQLSFSDLEHMSYGDVSTSLANRTLLEKMLMREALRCQRYGAASCLMFVELDPVQLQPGYVGEKPAIAAQQASIAKIFRDRLRALDIAGRWDNRRFLVLLPEINIEGATLLAERLLQEVRNQRPGVNSMLSLTASIGVAEIGKSAATDALESADRNLKIAQSRGGNCFIAEGVAQAA